MKKTNSDLLVDEKCPYWALNSSKECGLFSGGVYIPMPKHVRTFCLAANHYQCSQYTRGCDLILAQDEYENDEFLGSGDRRRLRRYPGHLYLDLVACDKDFSSQVMNYYKAKSLDVSLGGLRVESSKELVIDDIVSFMMDPDFSSESLIGVGEVKWCKPRIGQNKFESGIAFSNYSTSESIKEYLKI